MQRAQVIIGANYGDEGKGLMTDYFASRNPSHTIVVRFNGGAQAGHTVVTPDGRRHVFSHFGSGSFLDCPSFLSRYFIVNPMLFVKEQKLLNDKNVFPVTYVDPLAIVSTPFDVFINQLLEIRRGGGRHGSCGLGINETVIRSLRGAQYKLQVKDLLKNIEFYKRLQTIKEEWFPARLKELKIDLELDEVKSFQEKIDKIIGRYLEDVEAFLTHCKIQSWLPKQMDVLFEGAQGLLLDEARIDKYPHLTRSRTGLNNVVELAKDFGIRELAVTYVTRSYLTKHGAGPLPNEEKWAINDDTNIPNPFQGTLRFAQLDTDELTYSILLDLNQAKARFPKITANIAITCADQMAIPEQCKLPLPVRYIASGPSRVNVIEKEFDIPVLRELASAAVA